ncbi:MAG: structural protein P5 [Rikenellaceae bacterium]
MNHTTSATSIKSNVIPYRRTRAERNNNPGNIRHSKDRFRGEVYPCEDPLFKVFTAPEWGYRAVYVILRTYILKYELTTISEIIPRWAPTFENDTDAYIQYVSAWADLDVDMPIDPDCPEQMMPLAAAISRVESGRNPVEVDYRKGWELYSEGC